ncbi:MAG: hypothetical protein ABGZ35_31830, partial [Planctomycetaceae bacterium]
MRPESECGVAGAERWNNIRHIPVARIDRADAGPDFKRRPMVTRGELPRDRSKPRNRQRCSGGEVPTTQSVASDECQCYAS